MGLVESHSRGVSQRAGPHSPRGAALHCTVTACLVLTRQVNSVPPLLTFSLFFLFSLFTFLFFFFFFFFFPSLDRPSLFFPVFRVPPSTAALCCDQKFSQRVSNSRQLFLYIVKYGLAIRFVCYVREHVGSLEGLTNARG